MTPTVRVLAAVVTYNREVRLARVLDALVAQSASPDAVLVVDNASTDGTRRVVEEHPVGAHYFNTGANTGGAGGFAWCVELALAGGYDFVWLLDDDAVPDSAALERLLAAAAGDAAPAVTAAAVVDETGQLVVGNEAAPSKSASEHYRAALRGAIAITSCSFVGPLISTAHARQTHLPLVDYFIWNDDVEYTGRLCALGGGLLVPSARITHASGILSVDGDMGQRLYYEIRNKIWLALRSDALPLRRRLSTAYWLPRKVLGQRRVAQDKALYRRSVLRGVRDGVVKRPTKLAPGALLAATTQDVPAGVLAQS